MSERILAQLAAADPVMARLIEAVGPFGLVPKAADAPFRHLARAITYQQLNGIAAGTIFRRLVALFHPDDPEAFPSPAELLAMPDARLRAAGYSASKIAALKDLSAKALDGIVPDTATLLPLDDDAIVARLTAVRGIGRWTVEMMLMFQLGRPDVLPVDDFGVRNGFRLAYGLRAMPAPRALAQFGARWAPQRSAAAWYLWRACDLHKAGRLPAPLRPAPRLRAPAKRKAKAKAKAMLKVKTKPSANARARRPSTSGLRTPAASSRARR
ncbi:MAG: DNA-3-methyladenine glycosylase 2 family protein [Steroidobacteraceae bacterium]